MKKFLLVGVLAVGVLVGCGKSDGSKGSGEYMLYCQKMIKRESKYPSTVSFNNYNTKIVKDGGEVTVVMPFSAKNAFGVASDYVANCTMNKDGTNQQIFIH